jgi:hypothetical protein
MDHLNDQPSADLLTLNNLTLLKAPPLISIVLRLKRTLHLHADVLGLVFRKGI